MAFEPPDDVRPVLAEVRVLEGDQLVRQIGAEVLHITLAGRPGWRQSASLQTISLGILLERPAVFHSLLEGVADCLADVDIGGNPAATEDSPSEVGYVRLGAGRTI